MAAAGATTQARAGLCLSEPNLARAQEKGILEPVAALPSLRSKQAECEKVGGDFRGSLHCWVG